MASSAQRFSFTIRCVEASGPAIREMVDRARQISRETFMRRCNWKTVAAELGYIVGPGEKGLRLKDDYHVSYHRSRYRGLACYYLVWSAIEHVFVEQSQR